MRKIDNLAYRMRLRKELCKLPKEMVVITLEECKRILEKGDKK